MADKKISALTGATTPLAGTEVLPVVQGGATVKVAVSDLTAGRAVTAASVNKVAITAPATASTLTIADGKTLAVNDNATLGTGGLTLGNSGGFTAAASKVLTANNSLTLAGTDATTQTFPTTSATIARTDAAQTFTGNQTLGTGNIVQGTAAKGFNFTANTPSTGSTSQLLAYYDEITSASAACTGAITTAVIWKATRIGNHVTLTLPSTTGTASTATNFVYGVALPTAFRPSAAARALCIIADAGALLLAPGYVLIDSTSGSITVYKDAAGATNFTAAAVAGLFAQQSFSWVI